MSRLKRKTLSFNTYNFCYAIWTVLGVYNFYFWRQVFSVVSLPVFVLLVVASVLFMMILQSLIFHPKMVKVVSILLLMMNTLASYFINMYHLVLNKTMLANILDTNFFEATEWMGIAFWMYVLAFGVLPSWIVWRVQIQFNPIKERFVKTGCWIGALMLLLSVFIPYKDTVKVFLKTHFNLRYQFVPTGYISAGVSLFVHSFKHTEVIDSVQGMRQDKYWQEGKKNLIVFVLGESARDANFSLTGYARDTAQPLRPYLQDMFVFHNTESCGVVTRVSVPCMFGVYSRQNYIEQAVAYTPNALEILQKNGVKVFWLDNELGCNKVCRNVVTEYTCKERDCLDVALNEAFKRRLPSFQEDTMVVLHQRGSHGPRYDLRVPDELKKWAPFCDRSDHQNCSRQELVNAYDNTMHYTTFLIADLIQTLTGLTDEYNPVLIYISDHGESLGENDVYGHGGDFADAPVEQKQVPFFVWMPDSSRKSFGFDKNCLIEKTKNQQSQDVIFHSLLGLLGVYTDVYDDKLDVFAGCHH